jgi:hypothetical protein
LVCQMAWEIFLGETILVVVVVGVTLRCVAANGVPWHVLLTTVSRRCETQSVTAMQSAVQSVSWFVVLSIVLLVPVDLGITQIKRCNALAVNQVTSQPHKQLRTERGWSIAACTEENRAHVRACKRYACSHSARVRACVRELARLGS